MGGLPNTAEQGAVAATAASLCTCTRSTAAAQVILNSGFDKCCHGYCTQWWSGREEALLSGTAAHMTRASSKTTWS